MVGHGSILAFDESTDMREVARTCFASAPTRVAASASPAASGCGALTTRSPPTHRSTARSFEELLEVARGLGSLCAHGGGIPAPMRSLLTHFPEELGLA